MKKLLLSTGILCAGFSYVAAQDADTISVLKGNLGASYTLKGKILTVSKLEKTLLHNKEAMRTIRSGKPVKTVALVMSFAGGGLLGWSLADLMFKGKVNPYVAGSGVALVGLSIPLSLSYDKKLQKAVRLYNASLR